MVDLINAAFCDTPPENPNIREKELNRNEFVELKYFTPLLDRSLDEIGERCHNAHFFKGYHVLICTLRVCLVNPKKQSFYLPPLKSRIIDAVIHDLFDDYLLLCVAVNGGIYFLTIKLADSPQICSNYFFPLKKCVSKLYFSRSSKSLICCYLEGGLDTVFLSMNESLLNVISASIKSNKFGWFTKFTSSFYSKNYKSSFFDKQSGFLITLYDGVADLYMESDKKCFELVDSIKCPTTCVSVVASPNCYFFAYLVHSSGNVTPVSLLSKQNNYWQLHIHAEREIPLPLALRNIKFAASGKESVFFYNNQYNCLAILCERCSSSQSHGQIEDILTISHLDSQVCAILAGEGSNNFSLYHENGRISLVNRFSSGEVFYRQFNELSEIKLPSLQLSPLFCSSVLLEAMHLGLSFSVVRSTWNELMTPFESLQESNKEETVWNLSYGAKGCAHYFGQLLSSLHRYYQSSYSDELQNEIQMLEEKTLFMLLLVQNFLTEEGWLEGGETDCTEAVEWDEHLRMHNLSLLSSPFKSSISAQAQFLRKLLQFVLRSLGYSFLLRTLNSTMPSFLKRSYQMHRSSSVDWVEFISRSDLEDWEDARFVELLEVLISRQKSSSSHHFEMHDETIASVKAESNPIELDSLYYELEEVSPYLSKKSQVAMHLYSYVYKSEYEAALSYSLENVSFLLHSQLLDRIISLLQKGAPMLFPAIKLLIEEEYNYGNLSTMRKDDILYVREDILKLLFEELHRLELNDALLHALLYVVKRIVPNTQAHEKELEKTSGCQTFLSPTSSRRSRETTLQSPHSTALSAIFSWMEHYPLDDWRIPVFETVLINTKALWDRYLKGDLVLPTGHQRSEDRCSIRFFTDKSWDYRLSFSFFRCVILAAKGGSEEVHDAIAELLSLIQSDSCHLTLPIRLQLVKRADSLASQLPSTASSSSTLQSSLFNSTFSSVIEKVKWLNFQLLLQEQLEQCLESQLHLEIGDSPVSCSQSPRWRASNQQSPETAKSTSFLPPSCSNTSPLTEVRNDHWRLKYQFLLESDLLAMAIRYRSIGGASIELDLKKTHPDSSEESVEEAMSYLLWFLHNSANPRLNAEEVVKSVLQDPFLLLHFYAPFPWYSLTSFILCNRAMEAESDTNTSGVPYSHLVGSNKVSSVSPPSPCDVHKVVLPTKESCLTSVAQLFLTTPVPPLSLFFFLCRILTDRLRHEEEVLHQEAAGATGLTDEAAAVGLERTVNQLQNSQKKTWPEEVITTSFSDRPCPLPLILPLSLLDTSNDVASSPTSTKEFCWQYLIPLQDIISALLLVLSSIQSEEDRLQCHAQLELFPVELFEQ